MMCALTTSSVHATSGWRRPGLLPGPHLPGRLRSCFLEGRLTQEQLDNFRQEVHAMASLPIRTRN